MHDTDTEGSIDMTPATAAEVPQRSREALRESIREELTAFPGVTVSMLHSRLTVKRPGWREELDACITEGIVLSVPDLVNGRGIRRLYWQDEDISEVSIQETTTS
jgi:hypothetical protein